jgi:hypothetical protein
VGDVAFHCAPRYAQPGGDVAVGQALPDQLHHMALAWGEALPAGLRAGPGAATATADPEAAQGRLGPGQRRRRAQGLEDPDPLLVVAARVLSSLLAARRTAAQRARVVMKLIISRPHESPPPRGAW